MAAQATIVAYDGATTPVSHSFIPMGVLTDEKLGDVAKYREAYSSIPVNANPRVTMLRKALRGGLQRVEIRVEVPVQETATGANAQGYTAPPKIAYVDQASAVFYFGDRTTIAGRRLIRQLLVNVLGGVTTSVTPGTTFDAAQLVDLDVVPS